MRSLIRVKRLIAIAAAGRVYYKWLNLGLFSMPAMAIGSVLGTLGASSNASDWVQGLLSAGSLVLAVLKGAESLLHTAEKHGALSAQLKALFALRARLAVAPDADVEVDLVRAEEELLSLVPQFIVRRVKVDGFIEADLTSSASALARIEMSTVSDAAPAVAPAVAGSSTV